jgi:hypothetical protein
MRRRTPGETRRVSGVIVGAILAIILAFTGLWLMMRY